MRHISGTRNIPRDLVGEMRVVAVAQGRVPGARADGPLAQPPHKPVHQPKLDEPPASGAMRVCAQVRECKSDFWSSVVGLIYHIHGLKTVSVSDVWSTLGLRD